jgi:hypothetical protein
MVPFLAYLLLPCQDSLVLVVLIPKRPAQEGIFFLGRRLAQLSGHLISIIASFYRGRLIRPTLGAANVWRTASLRAAIRSGRASRLLGDARYFVAGRASRARIPGATQSLIGRGTDATAGHGLALRTHKVIEILEGLLEGAIRAAGRTCARTTNHRAAARPTFLGACARAGLARFTAPGAASRLIAVALLPVALLGTRLLRTALAGHAAGALLFALLSARLGTLRPTRLLRPILAGHAAGALLFGLLSARLRTLRPTRLLRTVLAGHAAGALLFGLLSARLRTLRPTCLLRPVLAGHAAGLR